MRFICLIIGTILVLLFLVMERGKKYDALVENLDNSEYPLKSIYCVGFALMRIKVLGIPAGIYEKMIGQARLIYDPKYSEYYVNLTWAQMLSFVHFMLTLGFIVSGLLNSILFAFAGIVGSAVSGYYFYTLMNEKLKDRGSMCNIELPEVVSSMALLINSGMVLQEAWETVAYSKEGEIYTLMQNACLDMQNGMSESDAIYRFGIMSTSPEIKKFVSSVIQGVEKGSSELSMVLMNQSSEMWNIKRQYMLQKGEAAASKLLGPIAIIFLGIIILVVAGAAGMLTV